MGNGMSVRERGFTLVEMLVALVVAVSLLGVAATLIKRQNTDIAATNTAEQLRAIGKAALLYSSANEVVASLDLSKPGGLSRIAQYLPANLSSIQASPFDSTYFVLARKQNAGVGLATCASVPSMSVASKIASLLGVNGVYVATRRDGTRAFSGASGTLNATEQFSKDFLEDAAQLGGVGTQPGEDGAVRSVVCYANSTEQAKLEAQADDVWLHRNKDAGHPEWNRMSAPIDMGGYGASNVGGLQMSGAGEISNVGGLRMAETGAIHLQEGNVSLEKGTLRLLSRSSTINFNVDQGVNPGDECRKGDMAVGSEGKILACRLSDDGQGYRFASIGSDVITPATGGQQGMSLSDLNQLWDVVQNFPNKPGPAFVRNGQTKSLVIDIPPGGASREISMMFDLSRPLNRWRQEWRARFTNGHMVLIYAVSMKRGESEQHLIDYQQCHLLDMGTCRLTVRAYAGYKTWVWGAWGGDIVSSSDVAADDKESKHLTANWITRVENPFQPN